MVRGFLSVPTKYQCEMRPRSAQHASVMREAFKQAEKDAFQDSSEPLKVAARMSEILFPNIVTCCEDTYLNFDSNISQVSENHHWNYRVSFPGNPTKRRLAL